MKKVIDDIKRLCADNGVRFLEGEGKTVRLDKGYSRGYFDQKNKVLAYAKNAKNSLCVLLHESCHLEQWLEGDLYDECYGVMWEWVMGAEYSEKEVEKAINGVIACELDCEKRTVKKIKQYGLDIDAEEYIRSANAYLFFFHWMKITRRWVSPKNSFYEKKDLIAACPSKFLRNYDKCPIEILRLFAKYNI